MMETGAFRTWEGRRRLGDLAFRLSMGVMIVIAITFIAVPLASLFLKTSYDDFLGSLGDPTVSDALWLSMTTATISTLVVLAFGTPLAYLNARYEYRGKTIVDTITDLPAVLPPAVAGLALLMAFGRRGILGEHLDAMGIEIAFTTAAVILAQVFVSAPFYIRQAKMAFQSVDPDYEDAARTMGSSKMNTFVRVHLPLAAGGLMSGAISAWARALGEFGATIMFAGNMAGVTQTMPLAIYSSFEGSIAPALSLSIILVAISFAVMMSVKLLGRKMSHVC